MGIARAWVCCAAGVPGRGYDYTAVPVTRSDCKTVVTPRVRDRCPSVMARSRELCAHRQLGGCPPVAAACTMFSAVVRTLTLPSGSRRGDQGVAQPSL